MPCSWKKAHPLGTSSRTRWIPAKSHWPSEISTQDRECRDASARLAVGAKNASFTVEDAQPVGSKAILAVAASVKPLCCVNMPLCAILRTQETDSNPHIANAREARPDPAIIPSPTFDYLPLSDLVALLLVYFRRNRCHRRLPFAVSQSA